MLVKGLLVKHDLEDRTVAYNTHSLNGQLK